MTISSQVRIAGPFTGSGAVSSFPFSFKIYAAEDLMVVSVDAAGDQSNLDLDTDYSVTVNGDQNDDPGGSVTLLRGPLALGSKLIITSIVSPLQQTELTNQGGFYPEVITDALDKLTILVQQLQGQVDRCLKLPVIETGPVELGPASQRAGKILVFNANGDLTYMMLAPGAAVPAAQECVGDVDGVNATFQFVASESTQPIPTVYAAGIWKNPVTDYGPVTHVGGDIWEFTFTTPPNLGPIIVALFA